MSPRMAMTARSSGRENPDTFRLVLIPFPPAGLVLIVLSFAPRNALPRWRGILTGSKRYATGPQTRATRRNRREELELEAIARSESRLRICNRGGGCYET